MLFNIFQIFIGALIVGFSGAVTPGPMFTLVISRTAQKGFWASFFIVSGHAIMELMVLMLFLAGIIKYLNNNMIIKIIGVAGGTVLLFLSFELLYSTFKNKTKVDLNKKDMNVKLDKDNKSHSVFQGMFVSIINPYWYVWWVTVGSAFLIKSMKYGITGVSSFYIGHIFSDFIWYLFIGFLVSKGRKFISKKIYKAIMISCGIFLLYLGIKFIMDFIKR
ncbi:MAG: LysE family transporter [Actinomycetota bacterium]|nr:LysE family transporter [Actinomycetota bacterium]